jgi:hypothetical protein
VEDPTAEEVPAEESGGNRRDLFTKVGAAAAVAAVAGITVSGSAEAADGDPMLIGRVNEGNSVNTTRLSGGSSLYVIDGVTLDGSSASIRGESTVDVHAGVRGEASGSAGRGVYGINSGDRGIGVRGENSASGGYGVYGLHSANGSHSAGVFGRNTGSGNGVWGSTTDDTGAGVYGAHQAPGGVGVLGAAADGSGVVGRGSSFDVLADRSGKIGLSKAGTTGAAASGTVGTIARDADGTLWYCYATNKWEQVTGLAAPAAPAQFTAIAPIRAYDGRIAAIPQSGVFAARSNKVISVKDGRDQTTGVVDSADAVPAGANAVAYNVTATNTTARGFLAVVPGDVASSAVSSLNWPAGSGFAIANAGIVGLDVSRQVRIIAGPAGFDAIVDITGYFS